MGEWRRIPIVDLCETHVDCVNRTAPSVAEPTPFKMIRTTNVRNGFIDTENVKYVEEATYHRWTRRLVPKRNDVILTREAPLGDVGMVRNNDQIFLGQRLYHFRPDPGKLDPFFLLYSLLADDLQAQIKGYGSGSTVEHMRLADIPLLEINAPAIEEQQKIAAILSAYDDLIENNLRRIKILEEMAQNLYREWFVKFRFPGHEQVRMVDSPLGKIPERWEVASIDDVAMIHRGRSYRSNDLLDEGGLPFINLKCIDRDGGFRRDGLKRYEGQYKETQKVVSGDIVMAVTDMTQERRIVARAGRVPTLDSDFGVISMDLVKIEPKEGISPDYLYGYFRGSDFADNVKQHANGANVLHLSPDRIKEYQFVFPAEDVRERFTAFSALVFQQIENLNRRNVVLRQTRDLLLPRLISGELDVSELDIDFGEAA